MNERKLCAIRLGRQSDESSKIKSCFTNMKDIQSNIRIVAAHKLSRAAGDLS